MVIKSDNDPGLSMQKLGEQRDKYNVDWSVKHEKKKNCAQEKWIVSRSTVGKGVSSW